MSSLFEQLGRLLEPLVDQPVTQRILSEASVWRDRTMRAQEAAMAALGVPTTSDVGKIERRVRGLSDAFATLEEQLDRVEARLSSQAPGSDQATLDELRTTVEALRAELAKRES